MGKGKPAAPPACPCTPTPLPDPLGGSDIAISLLDDAPAVGWDKASYASNFLGLRADVMEKAWRGSFLSFLLLSPI